MKTRSTPLPLEIIGWYGTIAILAAYMLLGSNVIEPGNVYHFLNATGAAGIGLVSWSKRAWQPVTLNIIWCGVAVVALLRINI